MFFSSILIPECVKLKKKIMSSKYYTACVTGQHRVYIFMQIGGVKSHALPLNIAHPQNFTKKVYKDISNVSQNLCQTCIK